MTVLSSYRFLSLLVALRALMIRCLLHEVLRADGWLRRALLGAEATRGGAGRCQPRADALLRSDSRPDGCSAPGAARAPQHRRALPRSSSPSARGPFPYRADCTLRLP